ncbi:MAG TPA: YbhB/YbcL family Raf kinase inhibitor-like protein [Clostridia bacterium]|nr:YbhB/YbcL family Raf kinase inhibitor-like protein [Clostridia bacterium]
MKKIIIIVCFFVILIAGIVIYSRMSRRDYVKPPVNLEVTSNAFEDGGIIPLKYTGRGEDVSPEIKLDTVDAKAKTIAIIMDDLDNPVGVFNHWVIWNISADFDSIPEGIPRKEVVPSLGNAIQGKSDYGGKHWYRGPLPPFGTHKYMFKVYILDVILNLDKDSGKIELQKAMKGHILQYGTLSGRFGR